MALPKIVDSPKGRLRRAEGPLWASQVTSSQNNIFIRLLVHRRAQRQLSVTGVQKFNFGAPVFIIVGQRLLAGATVSISSTPKSRPSLATSSGREERRALIKTMPRIIQAKTT